MPQALRQDKQLVVLTRYDSGFGVAFLDALTAHGVAPALIVVSYTSLTKRWRMCRFLARKIGWGDALRYNIGFLRKVLWRNLSFGKVHPLPDFAAYGAPVLQCADVNDAHVISALSNPEYRTIILAQSGIVREELLALPNKWIVNAHPGCVPEFRGVDVVKWALWFEKPVAVTLHIVRRGIDTGEVLETRMVPVQAHDAIADVERRASDISIEMLVNAALKGPQAFQHPTPQPTSTAQQFYLMPFAIKRVLEHTWPNKRITYVATHS